MKIFLNNQPCALAKIWLYSTYVSKFITSKQTNEKLVFFREVNRHASKFVLFNNRFKKLKICTYLIPYWKPE